MSRTRGFGVSHQKKKEKKKHGAGCLPPPNTPASLWKSNHYADLLSFIDLSSSCRTPRILKAENITAFLKAGARNTSGISTKCVLMHLSEPVSESVLCADGLAESDYTAQTDRNTSYTYAHTRADPAEGEISQRLFKGGGGACGFCMCVYAGGVGRHLGGWGSSNKLHRC